MYVLLMLVFVSCGFLCSCSKDKPKGIHFGPGPAAEDPNDESEAIHFGPGPSAEGTEGSDDENSY